MAADCQKVMHIRAVLKKKSLDFLGSNFFNIRMPTKSLGTLPVNITLNLNCSAEKCIIVGLFSYWVVFF